MLDGNHPLASKALRFAIKVIDVRQASEEEITHQHVHAAHGISIEAASLKASCSANSFGAFRPGWSAPRQNLSSSGFQNRTACRLGPY